MTLFPTKPKTVIFSFITTFSAFKPFQWIGISALAFEIVGKKSELSPQEIIDRFLISHRLFSQKYEYGGMHWYCHEQKSLLIAVFKFKHERKIKIKANLDFYKIRGFEK